jgi:hypothetical protein
MRFAAALMLSFVFAGAASAATVASPKAAGSVFDHRATAADVTRALGDATRALQKAQTLRGNYTQSKTLQGVPKPLLAEGTFLFVRDRGIAWRTEKPFESELVITDSDIIQREGGRVSMRLSASQQPAVRVIAGIFASVFALDFAALEERFDLYCRKTAGGWELGLRPRGDSGALRQIVVSGRAQVERVRVADTHGDETDIRLRDTVVSAQAPAADELGRFTP